MNKCRFCGSSLSHTVVDLGKSPLCQSQLEASQLNEMERFYPLHVFVCGSCYLVQLEEYVGPEAIFSEYAYFSSYAQAWLDHARTFADMAIVRFNLNSKSQVLEIASNDGYLLQNFVRKGIPVLGIEPAANVARVAVEKGVPTHVEFFGTNLASRLSSEWGRADLIVGNNVLAHVPDLNDFVRGILMMLKPEGIVTMEFPHILRLLAETQFDTIYHEHFCYFSFSVVQKVFAAHGLTIFDVDEIPTHGGSLRVYARYPNDSSKPVSSRVRVLKKVEEDSGLLRLDTYSSFSDRVKETKWMLLEFLIRAKREGKSIVGYGAPGKGNTLLNYCGIRTDFVDYTVDRNPYKQGRFTPGTHIPIYHPQKIRETKPDYVLILPWNLKEEIMEQTSYIYEWGGQFVVPIPRVAVYSSDGVRSGDPQ